MFWYLLAIALANVAVYPLVRRSFLLRIKETEQQAAEFDEAVARGQPPMVMDLSTNQLVPDQRPIVLKDELPDMIGYSIGAMTTTSLVTAAIVWVIRWAITFF